MPSDSIYCSTYDDYRIYLNDTGFPQVAETDYCRFPRSEVNFNIEDKMEPYVSIRQPIRTYYVRPTLFYPTYRSGLDFVNRVLRVQPVIFQKVYPRYDLSATLTRDTGFGPLIEKLPRSKYFFPPKGPTYGKNLAKYKKISIEPWKGNQIDFLV